MSALTRTTSFARFLPLKIEEGTETDSPNTSSVSSMNSCEYNIPSERINSPKTGRLAPFDLAERLKEIGADLGHFEKTFRKNEEQYLISKTGLHANPTKRAVAYYDLIQRVRLRGDSGYKNEDGSLISTKQILSAIDVLDEADKLDVWLEKIKPGIYRENAIEAIEEAELALREADEAEWREQEKYLEPFDSADETELGIMSHFDRFGSYPKA